MKKRNLNRQLPIAYYDGECNFCYGLIRLLRKGGVDKKIHLLPIQLVSTLPPNELLVVTRSKVHKAGRAVIELLNTMGGIFYIPAFILKLLPPALLQKVYYWVANNRFRWFGTYSCSIH